jgi:hypothetical protein
MPDFIESKALLESPFYNEIRPFMSFLRKAEAHAAELKIHGRVFVCLPMAKTLAVKMGLPEGEVYRQIQNLMRLHWVRKYVEGDRLCYVMGTPKCRFMATAIQKRFRKAKRKATGELHLTEWRWLPLEKWTGTTVWEMIAEKLAAKGIKAHFTKAKGRWQMKNLCDEHGIAEVQAVAAFFVEQFEALRDHFQWTGYPTPGLFCGFYPSISYIRKKGIPGAGAHVRGGMTAQDTGEDEGWAHL